MPELDAPCQTATRPDMLQPALPHITMARPELARKSYQYRCVSGCFRLCGRLCQDVSWCVRVLWCVKAYEAVRECEAVRLCLGRVGVSQGVQGCHGVAGCLSGMSGYIMACQGM